MAGTTTHRDTDSFELFEGNGMGKGCFAVLRKSDNQTTLWNTGSEGAEEKDELLELSEEDFDARCSEMEFS
jgi:phage protein U